MTCPIEAFQEREGRLIRLERDRNDFLNSFDRLLEAGDGVWLMIQMEEMQTRLHGERFTKTQFWERVFNAKA